MASLARKSIAEFQGRARNRRFKKSALPLLAKQGTAELPIAVSGRQKQYFARQ
jgi:hypothetical protein